MHLLPLYDPVMMLCSAMCDQRGTMIHQSSKVSRGKVFVAAVHFNSGLEVVLVFFALE